MPIIYPKPIRRKLNSLNLEKVKKSLLDDGYEFIRDGGFRPEDEPFKLCNYLFYRNPQTKVDVRIGYDYPWFTNNKNVIFEICYATTGMKQWRVVTPDFRKPKWRKLSDLYDKRGNE